MTGHAEQIDATAPSGHECHVWWLALDDAPQDLALLERMLSPHERERAAAFRASGPRKQFVVARAAVRTVLGRYLDIAPAACAFSTSDQGKPSLHPPSPLRFNVSHSRDLVAIAVTHGHEVGIDVEAHRRLPDMAAIAHTILDTQDLQEWLRAEPGEQLTAFYRIWTCKEAMAKASGRGIGIDLRALRVGIATGSPARPLSLEPSWGAPSDWSLQELDVRAGYSAAVAAHASQLQVRQERLHL